MVLVTAWLVYHSAISYYVIMCSMSHRIVSYFLQNRVEFLINLHLRLRGFNHTWSTNSARFQPNNPESIPYSAAACGQNILIFNSVCDMDSRRLGVAVLDKGATLAWAPALIRHESKALNTIYSIEALFRKRYDCVFASRSLSDLTV